MPAFTTSFTLDATGVRQETDTGTSKKVDERDLKEFLTALGATAPLRTGIMPPGVRSYSQAGAHSQLVIECAPGVNLVYWGRRERDPDVKTYELAQPWRIIIADMLNGELLGARVFYSPVSITSGANQLYHTNLPNTNCRGYNGTSVGWVCLYKDQAWSKLPLSTKVMRVIDRCSGGEAYNDVNMSRTDGPRFYQMMNKPDYTYDPKAWEEKTKKQGIEWTLDEGLWVPIKVRGLDDQEAHVNGGVPLTLEMAMTGYVRSAYPGQDNITSKTALKFARDDMDKVDPQALLQETITTSFQRASKIKTATPKAATTKKQAAGAKSKGSKPIKNPFACGLCATVVEKSSMTEVAEGPTFVCTSCAPSLVKTCGDCKQKVITWVYQNGVPYCSACRDLGICAMCYEGVPLEDMSNGAGENELVCPSCVGQDMGEEELVTLA